MDNRLTLELYIRHAFQVGRSEDPAKTADQSYLTATGNLDLAKAAIGYSTLIYIERNLNKDEELYCCLKEIMNATTIDEINNIVNKANAIITRN